MTRSPAGRLDASQRRLVLAICVMSGAVTAVSASYNYVIDPMLEGLDASTSENALLRQLPSIASLLVIFLAGVLGQRWGARRLLRVAAITFVVGCLLVLFAPTFPFAAAGLVLQAIGDSASLVVSLGLLTVRIPDQKARASAFSVFAIVQPIIYIVYPLVTGALVDDLSWRWVALLWFVGGLAMVWASWVLLPRDDPGTEGGELLTAGLAGLALAAGVQTVTFAGNEGITSPQTIARAVAALLAGGALAVTLRLRRRPSSLSMRSLKRPGMILLLVVVVLLPFANLWYYATMAYQYIYGLDVMQTALAMVPAQLMGIAGAMVTRKLLDRFGVRQAGFAMLLVYSGSLVLTLAIGVGSPLWVPMAVIGLYAAGAVGASIPLTTAVMNASPSGAENDTAAYRSAATKIGSALGVVVTTGVMTLGITASLTDQLSSQGMADQQSAEIAAGIRSGATTEDLASLYSVPINDVDQVTADQQQGMVDGLHAVGVTGAVIVAVSALLFPVAVRRTTAVQT